MYKLITWNRRVWASLLLIYFKLRHKDRIGAERSGAGRTLNESEWSHRNRFEQELRSHAVIITVKWCVVLLLLLVRSVPPTHVQLSYTTDHTGDVFYSQDVSTFHLQLPIILRCHVTVHSANHIVPNVTVLFDDVDMTSQFLRSTVLSTRSQDGGSLVVTDYSGQFEWNMTLNEMLDLHTCNWTCRVSMPYYPPLMTSSIIYVTSK